VKRSKWVSLFIFLFPAVIVYTLFQFYPMLSGLYYGFTDWNGFSQTKNFVGMANFTEIISDPLIIKAVKNTIIFTVLVVIFQNGLALFFSILLDQKLGGISLFRAVFFLPVLLSTAVVGFIWSTIFNPIIGSWKPIFQGLGLDTIAGWDMLGNPAIALYSIIFVMIWQYMGYSMVIYLAGLQSIPKDMYEAANIDGANRWQQFKNVTFPLIAPALTINIILSSIGCLKVFDHVFVLTGGGPGDASQVVGTAIYTLAFSNNRFGYGIALSLLLFVCIAIISLIQLKFLRRREVEY
jgi:raffinose/stachyose/melibiose transport system permease protein